MTNDPRFVSMPVGQVVGRMNEIRPTAEVMAELVREYDEASDRIQKAR
jgi:hypothetical protein